jgi:flavin reductase (DIM6/NTAB) family NADH-FMN oxidoreductase RutF
VSARTAVRRLLEPIRTPQYVAAGFADPQTRVEVVLRDGGRRLDVTRNNVVVALAPLTLGVVLRGEARESFNRCDLEFRERDVDQLLGVIRLVASRDYALGAEVCRTFRIVSSRNDCIPPGWRWPYEMREHWRGWRQQRRNPHNFRLAPRDLQALFVFYSCPRPVVLVSVEHEGRSNLFPMDLIGATDSPLFSLSLRATSPAVELMKGSGRMALSSVPFSFRDAAYDLGKHHRVPAIDVASLPFPVVSSQKFGLPIPAGALRVREVCVEQVQNVGSHCWFLASLASDTVRSGEGAPLPLCHIHGAYRRYLEKRGVHVNEGGGL